MQLGERALGRQEAAVGEVVTSYLREGVRVGQETVVGEVVRNYLRERYLKVWVWVWAWA